MKISLESRINFFCFKYHLGISEMNFQMRNCEITADKNQAEFASKISVFLILIYLNKCTGT